MKTAIITTTIYIPKLLEDYIKDAVDNKQDCFFVVIGDKKTPVEAKKYCEDLGRQYHQEMIFMDVADQVVYLEKYPELAEHLPYNSIQRRNIGLLYAFANGAENIITIDDDNYLADKDFIRQHAVGEKEMTVVSSDKNWLNVCEYLEEKYGRTFYHRGFPQEIRFQSDEKKETLKKIKVVVNAGFWLDDPDIDALTRLYYLGKPVEVTRYLKENNFALEKGTWSPFNSQNTALAREVIPAYFLSPYIGRYDDIWAAYVVKKIADHLDHYISFGNPIVVQKRNPHNYWNDLAKESTGAMLTLKFVEILKNVNLRGDNYRDCFAELTEELSKVSAELSWPDDQKNYLAKYVEGMKIWVKIFGGLK